MRLLRYLFLPVFCLFLVCVVPGFAATLPERPKLDPLPPAPTPTLPPAGVHASVVHDRHVLIPRLMRDWKAKHPGAVVVMYVNTTAAVKAETDYCVTSSNAVEVVEHIFQTHGDDTEILFGPDMFLGAYVERMLGRKLNVWDGECHVHAGIRPDDINAARAAHPGADFLVHPECGCSTSVMEYVAAGDIASDGLHMLSTGGMLTYAQEHTAAEPERRTAIVATEIGMLHPLRVTAPDVDFIAANEAASCRYMKMITLPKLRDALRHERYEVKVDAAIADRARIPIERMVSIG